MPDSPMIPVSRAPRRSFLNDAQEDPAYRKWLIDQGHVDLQRGDTWETGGGMLGDERTGNVSREGSVFMEFDDPTQPGGKRYVARRKSKAPVAEDGTVTSSGGAKGRVMSFKDEAGVDAPFITEDKTFRPSINPVIAARYRGDFDRDVAMKRAEAEREKARAERLMEEDRARQARLMERRELGAIERENMVEQTKALRDLEAGDPRIMRRQELEVGALEEQAEQVRGSRARRRSFLEGADVPGISKRGEEEARAAIQQGADTPTAEAMARRAHEADVDEIRRLESSGDPAQIEEAARLREDPDLRTVRSFIPPDMARRADLGSRQAVMDVGGELVGDPALAPEEDLVSWKTAVPVLGQAKFGADLLRRAFRDPSAEMRTIQPRIEAAILKLQQDIPGLSEDEARSRLRSFLLRRGAPADRVDAVLAAQ